jgi:hypothetical protein
MADKYRTAVGIVQFDVKDGEAANKPVRNIVVNSAGFGPYAVRVSATLWPSHKDFKVEKNDAVILEGKYTTSTQEKDGEKITYHNLSVVRAINLGAADAGTKPETDENDVVDDPADEDIPF